jgi:hypothetical protein
MRPPGTRCALTQFNNQCSADPHHLDPDPAFHFDVDADPDLTFHLDADPNPDSSFHFNVVSNPSSL